MDLNTEGMTLDQINDEVLKASKPFWTEQFHHWEKTGFTKEMIDGAREFYFSKSFFEKGPGNSCGARMQLWTVIDKKIYKE